MSGPTDKTRIRVGKVKRSSRRRRRRSWWSSASKTRDKSSNINAMQMLDLYESSVDCGPLTGKERIKLWALACSMNRMSMSLGYQAKVRYGPVGTVRRGEGNTWVVLNRKTLTPYSKEMASKCLCD